MTDIPTGWIPASNPTLAEVLSDHLLAVWPGETEHRTGEDGNPRPVTLCTVWFIEGAEPVHHGDGVPVAWSIVREQLARSTPEAPWIVGKLKQKGRAFVLEPPSPAFVAKVSDKLAGIAAAYRLADAAPNPSAPADEGPF